VLSRTSGIQGCPNYAPKTLKYNVKRGNGSKQNATIIYQEEKYIFFKIPLNGI
jgi:hypothetical protein